MTVKAGFDRLKTWTVPGVTHVYGLDEFDGAVAESELPALVPMLSSTGGEGMRPLDTSLESGRVVMHVNHHLIVSGLGSRYKFYEALTLIDNYLAVVVGDLDLGGALLQPLTVADVIEGVIELAGVLYYGVTFRHRWVIRT